MRKLLLFCGLVLMLPVLMGVGLGPGLFSGGGGGGGAPANGEDTELCFLESPEHGTNYTCHRRDEATDFIQNIDAYMGRIGAHSLQTHRTVVNDSTNSGNAATAVRWNSYVTSLVSDGMLSNNVQIRSSQGCDLVGVGLGVGVTHASSWAVAAEDCKVVAMVNTDPTASTWSGTAGSPGGTWAYCNEHIELGQNGTNVTWGYGDDGVDNIMDDPGDHWVVPLTGCNAGQGPIMVMTEDNNGANSCDAFVSAQVTLWTVEDCSP